MKKLSELNLKVGMMFDPLTMPSEWRIAKKGEWIVMYGGDLAICDGLAGKLRCVLCDPPEPIKDIGWAMREIVAGREVVDPSGKRVRMGSNFVGVYRHERWIEGYFTRDDITGTWSEYIPAPAVVGTAAWFNGLPVGSACWLDSDRTQFARRTLSGHEWIDLVTGVVRGRCEHPTIKDGYTLILGADGQPAEPVVGSQLWGQICCRDLGLDVFCTGFMGGYVRWNKALARFDLYDATGRYIGKSYSIHGPEDINQTGWSIRKAEAKLVDELRAMREQVKRHIAEGQAMMTPIWNAIAKAERGA